jgi:hypothetical protein
MRHLLVWPPLLWAVRLLFLVYAGGLLYVTSLYLARFLRPRNARALMSGGLPALTRVEGTAKVMGQELTVNANLDKSDRLSMLEKRMHVLEARVGELAGAANQLLITDEPEETHG